MCPRRLNRWVLWLLPLFAVRALIPVGFMLAPAHGSLQLVLCPAQGAVVAPASAHVTAAHDHHGADAAGGAQHTSGSGLHDNSICPFALAGMVAVISAQATAASYLAHIIGSIPAEADRLPFAWPGGIERIRGPPLV